MVANGGYLALYNFLQNVHPALIPGSIATQIPNLRNGDILEDYIIQIQAFIDMEPLHGHEYSLRSHL